MPHRNRYLFVCTNRREEGNPKGSCAQQGSEELLKALKAALKERGLGESIARACGSTCLDLCEVGASVAVEPDHVVYGRVKLSDIPDIVEAVANDEVADHLVVMRGDRITKS